MNNKSRTYIAIFFSLIMGNNRPIIGEENHNLGNVTNDSAYDFEIMHQYEQQKTITLLNLKNKAFASGSESLIYEVEVSLPEGNKKIQAIIKLMKNTGNLQALMKETKREYGTMFFLQQQSYTYVPKVYAGLRFSRPLTGPAILMKKYGPDLSTIAGNIHATNFLKLAKNIVNAVAELHDLGLVHRDLKPENILYDNECKQSIKLTDFRSTRAIGTPSKDAGGNPSPMYWIPQFSWEEGEVDPQEDLFSLGLCLFYLRHGVYLQQFVFSSEQLSKYQIEALMLLHYKTNFLKKRDILNRNFPDQIDQMLLRLASPLVTERPTLLDLKELIDFNLKKSN